MAGGETSGVGGSACVPLLETELRAKKDGKKRQRGVDIRCECSRIAVASGARMFAVSASNMLTGVVARRRECTAAVLILEDEAAERERRSTTPFSLVGELLGDGGLLM